MKSSIYSLVIQDNLMNKVDDIALEKGMSRSQMVNEILAEYLGISTPEYKINKVMDFVCKEFLDRSSIRIMSNNKGSSVKLLTNIKYKYNPQLHYMLELKGKNKNKLATLKIQSRTQSKVFLDHLVRFFLMFTEIERIHEIGFRKNVIDKSYFVVDGNRFLRDFYYDWTNDSFSPERLSQFLINYISMINEAVNVYFENIGDTETTVLLMTSIYRKYMEM
jgi:metal-responsive CopG/Arc/MetJ family transcriptional regulator